MDALRMGREGRWRRRPKRRGMTRGALRSASEVRRWRSTEGVRLLDERGVWDVLRGPVALSAVVARPVEGRGEMRWTLRGPSEGASWDRSATFMAGMVGEGKRAKQGEKLAGIH